MNSLLCSVLLISVTNLILIDADCTNIVTQLEYIQIVINGVTGETETGCTQLCESDQCVSVWKNNYCFIFPSPVILVDFEASLSQCIGRCNDTADCLTLSHQEDFQLCYLFNSKLSAMSETYNRINSTEGTIAENLCH